MEVLRQIGRGLVIGLIVTGLAIGVALLIDGLFGGWAWHRFALVTLIIGGFLVYALLTTPGVGPPRTFNELVGRMHAGTLFYREPESGRIEGAAAIIPPSVVYLVLLGFYGF